MWYKSICAENSGFKFEGSKHAQGVFNAATGNMDAVDPVTFADQITKNKFASTLTPYTPEELAQKRLFKLKNAEIYYALNPPNSHHITGKPETDIVSLINNDRDTPGIAASAAMLHAIENGGSTLDCWDVGGFLPAIYRQFGFYEIGRDKYNVDAYGEPTPSLIKAWKCGDWEPGDPYPDVVYMKYGGLEGDDNAPDRRTVRENYLKRRSIYPSRTKNLEQGPGERLLLGNEKQNQQTWDRGIQESEKPPPFTNGEIPAQRSRIPSWGVKGTFHDGYSALHNMNDEELNQLGINPQELRNLPHE